MEDKYSCFEIFQIAEQVERNGADVYREVSLKTDDQELGTLFKCLSEWEKQHEQTFLELKKLVCDEVSDKRRFNPRQYMSRNPQALAKLAAFAINKDKSEILAKLENKTEVLNQAIKMEREVIVFFEGLKKFARDLYTKDQIGLIINEEKKHISILEQSLEMR
ncbi:MAG: ferritin-like domain-containing protein [Planctomycetota bacterium]|jgi:rubrerythrin